MLTSRYPAKLDAELVVVVPKATWPVPTPVEGVTPVNVAVGEMNCEAIPVRPIVCSV